MKTFLVLAVAILFSLFTCSHSSCRPCRVTRPAQSETAEAAGQTVVDAVLNYLMACGWLDSNTKLFLRRIAIAESRFGNDPDTFSNHGGIWQISSIGFTATKDTASHPALINKHKKVQRLFGINWPNLASSELRKPLHSAIAARLFLCTVTAPIPTTLQGQAGYWKRHYNTESGSGTEQDFIDRVNAVENNSSG